MNEMKLMLIKVGWPKQFVEKRVPIIPISGWCGDNLLEKSKNMPWWEGQKVEISKEKGCHVTTLKEGLDIFVQPAKRDLDAVMRLPLSGVYKIKGVGDVLTGRIEQGAAGDNIGMNVKALNKENMPRVGDVMIYKVDASLATTKNFSAQVQILDIP